MRVITCSSAYGQGGIGQHFAQLVEETRRAGALGGYYASSVKPGDEARGHSVEQRQWAQWLLRYTPLRLSPSWTTYVASELADRQVARRLSEPADRFMGFVGKALHSFRRASELGFEKLELIAANSHVNNLKRLHDQAARELDMNDTWLNEAMRRKTLKEYDMADIIYVHSEYVRRSFIEEGVDGDKLRRTVLQVDARFQPPPVRPEDDTFRIVYVGRVEATKGIPLLLEAFSQLSAPNAALTLVGGWSTRRMRRYMEKQMRCDPRISVAPGDPLPALQRADVFVHPTYEDGFGYAPMEALACGVPVIVTEDTGMKEYVREGENGFVVPTGDAEALRDRLEGLRRRPLKGFAPAVPAEGQFHEAGQNA